MKVLNLYAGIGGNRKLWTDVEVTAVELNPQIAKIYQDFFPSDKVVVGDAHQYLLEHFKEFEFIWSSPPCPSHSQFRKSFSCSVGAKPIYPDMKLYEEILLLKHYFLNKWLVENVISYYDPLIPPQKIQRHYFWANFCIRSLGDLPKNKINLGGGTNKPHPIIVAEMEQRLGFDLSEYKIDKETVLRNCIDPELGLHILNESKKDVYQELFK